MTDRLMALTEFTNYLGRYGSRVDAWPPAERDSALALLQDSNEAIQLLNAQTELDSTLGQLAMPEFPGLEKRILNQALPPKKLPALDRLIQWLIPHHTPGLWRPASAACLPLFFGILLSNYYSFGISEEQIADEAWSDELYILALNEYDQRL